MKNDIHSVQTLYNYIRSFYIKQFPHRTEFQALDIINYMLERDGVNGEIVFTNSKFHYNGEITGTNIYDNSEFLSALGWDINEFYDWLIQELYIIDGKATTKLLQLKRLIEI